MINAVKLSEIFQVGYHNWFLVGFYISLVGLFVFGILRPRRRVEWRSAGVAQGWVIALYAEMYGRLANPVAAPTPSALPY